MSLNDIAEAISIPKSTVSSYEDGRAKPKEETLKKLATLFKVTPEDLMFKNIERLLKLPNGNKNPTHPIIGGVGATNGKSKFLPESQTNNRSSLRTRAEGLDMGDVINLSLPELLQLQREGQYDDEIRILVAKLVYYQERIKALEEKNELLKDNLADLRAKKK